MEWCAIFYLRTLEHLRILYADDSTLPPQVIRFLTGQGTCPAVTPSHLRLGAMKAMGARNLLSWDSDSRLEFLVGEGVHLILASSKFWGMQHNVKLLPAMFRKEGYNSLGSRCGGRRTERNHCGSATHCHCSCVTLGNELNSLGPVSELEYKGSEIPSWGCCSSIFWWHYLHHKLFG